MGLVVEPSVAKVELTADAGEPLVASQQLFASQGQRDAMRQAYRDGIAWGEAKQQTFELINGELTGSRDQYEELIAAPGRIEETLREGAEKARAYASPFLARIRDAVGIKRLGC